MIIYMLAIKNDGKTVDCKNEEAVITVSNTEVKKLTPKDTSVDMQKEAEITYLLHMSHKKDAAKNSLEKEWYLQYRKIINDYAKYVDVPETIYDYYNEEELDRLFRVVQAEIGDEYTFAQKCNVASVILNRIEHEMFEDDMISVLSADQFATISNGRYKNVKVSENTMMACEFAFEIGDTTNGCLFFDSDRSLNYDFVFNDGVHNFYKLKE